MDFIDLYDESYSTDMFEYNNSELYFIQNDDYINTIPQLVEECEINTDMYDSKIMEECETNIDIYTPQVMEDCKINTDIYDSQVIKNCEINYNIYSTRVIKTVWDIKILNLNIREINKYIKTNNLTKKEIQQLKIERRRFLNRIYARNSRENKKN